MRYAESQYGEQPIAIGIFSTGDTVTIQVLDLSTDTLLTLTDASCTESAQISGFFYWDSANFQTQPTDFNQLLYVMSNTAGRQHPGKFVLGGYPSDSAIRRFQGAVHIDTTTGSAGTAFPIGTPESPVDNITDARTIADRESLTAYTLRGNVTVTADHENWTFTGVAPEDDYLTVNSGVSVAGSEFVRIGVRGDLSGTITCQECFIGTGVGTVTGLAGTFDTCAFNGTIQPAVGGVVQAREMISANVTIGTKLDFNNQQAVIACSDLIGLWSIRNLDQAATILTMSLKAAELTLESTVDAGIFRLGGYGEITYSQTSTDFLLDNVIRGSTVQDTAFLNAVHIDTINGTAGTDFPLGSSTDPVSNLADALTIASARGLRKFVVAGTITLTGALTNWVVEGTAANNGIAFVQLNGQNVAGSEFRNVAIAGNSSGFFTGHGLEFFGLCNGIQGYFRDCSVLGTLTPAANSNFWMFDAKSGVAGTSTPVLDLTNHTTGGAVNIRGYSGGIAVRNCNVSNFNSTFEFIAGQIVLENTLTAGTYVVRGVVKVTDNSAGATVDLEAALARTPIQELLLSDATPFAGAFIDAAISSRAVAGDQMALTAAAIASVADAVLAEPVGDHEGTADSLAAVIRRISHHTVGRAKFNTSNASQWTLDVYEDDDDTTVTAQFNLKKLDGTPINDANPLIDPVIADVDPV